MTEQSRRGRIDPPDLDEKGGLRNGEPQRSSTRLFMQLLVFGEAPPAREVADSLAGTGLETVVYEDVNDPNGVGILGISELPDLFVDRFLPAVRGAVKSARQKHDLTMFGRTYALGYEQIGRASCRERV